MYVSYARSRRRERRETFLAAEAFFFRIFKGVCRFCCRGPARGGARARFLARVTAIGVAVSRYRGCVSRVAFCDGRHRRHTSEPHTPFARRARRLRFSENRSLRARRASSANASIFSSRDAFFSRRRRAGGDSSRPPSSHKKRSGSTSRAIFRSPRVNRARRRFAPPRFALSESAARTFGFVRRSFGSRPRRLKKIGDAASFVWRYGFV